MHDWDSGNPVVFTLGSRSDYLAAVGPVALRFASTDHTVASWAPLADLMPKKPEPPVKKPKDPVPPTKPVDVAKDDSEEHSVVTKISPTKQGNDFHLKAAEVVKFFQGGSLDNASGTTPYTGAKLRFDPALPGSANASAGGSSKAIYTQK